MSARLPPLVSRDEIRTRLLSIFPDGTLNRADVTNRIAASTVFVALYIGAVEGGDTLLQPKPIYRMTEEQAALTDNASRLAYAAAMKGRGRAAGTTRWYEDKTRESIRDDTLREGLVMLGAVIVAPGVAVTANKPRYVLAAGFARLFDPALVGGDLEAAITSWRTTALSAGALARIALTLQGSAIGGDRLLITFPNGETRRMKPGPSAFITKAVVEVFAPRFLQQPAVISTSDSGEKVYQMDDARARAIGLNIQADQNLPDVVLIDLAPADPLLVFVEVVATDGPISDRRMQALQDVVRTAGFPEEHVAFVTAYLNRAQSAFKKTVPSLAWGSYAWFAAEPDNVLVLSSATQTLSGRL